VADMIQSVNFARDNNILLSVRGGGHNTWPQRMADWLSDSGFLQQ